MANISTDINNWSATPASNQPDSADTADLQGDLRALQAALKIIFPNIGAALTPTHTELNYVDGVTSAIQAQLNAKAASGANSDITALSALSSVNGGALAGFRNYIINGNCQVAQRGQGSLSSAYQYGQVDNFQVAIIGGTGVTGTTQQNGLTAGVYGVGVTGSWTNGQFSSRTAIESVDAAKLNGKNVTISAKVYQNTGVGRGFEILVYKPSVADNYGTSTLISTSTAQAAPHDTITAVSHTFTLGATDASNGLAVYIRDTAANSVVSKSYTVGSVQLEEGAVATPIENRPYATELTLCQRYYEKNYNLGIPPASAVTQPDQTVFPALPASIGHTISYGMVSFKTPKAFNPTVKIYSRDGSLARCNNDSGGNYPVNSASTYPSTTGFHVYNACGSTLSVSFGTLYICWVAEASIL